MQDSRRIGILTSGGDAPGMNAAIRAVTCAALSRGMEVMGIYDGYAGLLAEEMKLFSYRDVADAESRGGTLLYSARCDAFREAQGQEKAVAVCHRNGLDGLIVIGGDGTLRGAQALCDRGIPCIGIPATIDNDIVATEASIGFDSAVNTATRMMDCLKDTSESHARCNVVEVMGRSCGDIALQSGIAVGAVGIALLEFPFCPDHLCQNILRMRRAGKRDFLVVVAEGKKKESPAVTDTLTRLIEEKTGIETRSTVLGHVVRGGAPGVADRLLGARMGAYAVSLLAEGQVGQVVGTQQGKLWSVPIPTALAWERAYRGALDHGWGKRPSVENLNPPLLVWQKRLLRLKEDYRLGQMLAGEEIYGTAEEQDP